MFQGPQTPEPMAETEAQLPSPPRPRFRLRKRNTANLNAPTQHFLASVAAADVPIPSIEEPLVLDEDMVDSLSPAMPQFTDLNFLVCPHEALRGRTRSPPKTPTHRAVPSLSPKRFPNWSIDHDFSSLESSPECESSRPSTAQSTQTSSSLFSRFSFASDELSDCVSPDIEHPDRFADILASDDTDKTAKAPKAPLTIAPSKPQRKAKAPWTKAMSHHLWTTYMTYLQDPKVTPFRIGKSGIPPHGVCLRVAREAKRSWRGSRPQRRPENESGSATPTVDASSAFMQWPHTCAATRAYLRDLCKANSGTAARNHQYLAHSATPFGKTATRFWNRRSAPLRSPSVFSGSEMALSLAVSTCDSMQPHGPLAQLTGSKSDDTPKATPVRSDVISSVGILDAPPLERARLGSPFIAKSYGPSSSNTLADTLGLDLESQRQNRTVGPRRSLGSPAKLNQSRGNTQKRRSRQSLFELRRSKRPSLGSDFWTDPTGNSRDSNRDLPNADFNSTKSLDATIAPRTNLQQLFDSSRSATSGELVSGTNTPPTGLALSLTEMPRRLGSPFSVGGTSLSFPNRLYNISGINLGAIRRPFATIQQPTDGNTTPTKSSLQTRLAYIDERLKDLRRRGRRSQSPL